MLCVHIIYCHFDMYHLAAVFSSHPDSLKKFRFAYLRNIYSLYCYHFYHWTHNEITLFVRNRTSRAWPVTSNLFLGNTEVRYYVVRNTSFVKRINEFTMLNTVKGFANVQCSCEYSAFISTLLEMVWLG